jgi:hypothetical protein
MILAAAPASLIRRRRFTRGPALEGASPLVQEPTQTIETPKPQLPSFETNATTLVPRLHRFNGSTWELTRPPKWSTPDGRFRQLEEAERVGREAVAIASATDVLDLRAQALADLAEVLRLAERSQEARAVLEEAIRLYDEKGNVVAAGQLRALLAEPPVEV